MTQSTVGVSVGADANIASIGDCINTEHNLVWEFSMGCVQSYYDYYYSLRLLLLSSQQQKKN